jgi:hypothetical protein
MKNKSAGTGRRGDRADLLGAVYEFRFLTDDRLWAVHTVALENDTEACERARAYLAAVEGCSCVVVRNGVRFMRKITRWDGAEGATDGSAAPRRALM